MEPWICSTVALLLSVADPALGIKLPNVGAVAVVGGDYALLEYEGLRPIPMEQRAVSI